MKERNTDSGKKERKQNKKHEKRKIEKKTKGEGKEERE